MGAQVAGWEIAPMTQLAPTPETALPTRTLDTSRLPDHIDRLTRAARALTGSAQEAEDLVAETMVRVLSRPRRVHGDDDLGYLLRALRNTWSDTLRTRSRRPSTAAMPADLEPEDAFAGRRAHARAEANEVLAAVARLAPVHRDAILLVDVAGMTYTEAAQELGVPRGTIMSRLARGRSAVIAQLEPVAA